MFTDEGSDSPVYAPVRIGSEGGSIVSGDVIVVVVAGIGCEVDSAAKVVVGVDLGVVIPAPERLVVRSVSISL